MDTLEFINKTYGVNYQESELNCIMKFSLLWNVFEGKKFNSSFNITKFEGKINNLTIDVSKFDSPLKYFRKRYVENEQTNTLFNNLNFRANDKKDLVRDVLLGVENNPNKMVLAIGIIVYRIRNNFFHGLKDIVHMNGQKENFKMANLVLKNLISIL